MPEQIKEVVSAASPVARSGGGDISGRELSRERYALQTTPPARTLPVHPKKQLFSAPVNKFTAKTQGPSSNLARIKSCLHEYRKAATPVNPRSMKIAAKALSMEDLTPIKRNRKEKKDALVPVSSPRSGAEQQAADRIGRFMILAAWRRRKLEVGYLKKTLTFQVTCSERLRIQVCTLKSLLDSDNAKVRLAMKELERLKQLLHEREMEKQVLEREKMALEGDISAAQDKASEMSVGWRNCRNELEAVRASAAICEHALDMEKAATTEARSQRDHAYARLTELEDELSQHEALLSAAENAVSSMKRELEERQKMLDKTRKELAKEQKTRERSTREVITLSLRVNSTKQECENLRLTVEQLRAELLNANSNLTLVQEQLDWWPRPLTRMVGAARYWIRSPKAWCAAVLWVLSPPRHGC